MRLLSPLLADFWLCLGFYTRLPIPGSVRMAPLDRFSHAIRMLPFAGALVGVSAALALGAATALGFQPILTAPIALSWLLLASGALHEDGLADCADGFFGGATRERKLEIMRDSRIGTYGAAALTLSLYVRAASLTLIANQGYWLAAAVLTGGAALSRTAALIPMAVLSPARQDGAGFAAGRPRPKELALAAFLAILFALAPLTAGAELLRALIAIAAATAAAYAIVPLARRQIGGQSGDVAGAAQQLGEIAFYLVYAARL